MRAHWTAAPPTVNAAGLLERRSQTSLLCSQAQGSLSSDELRVHLSVPSDNVVINNTHSYSSRYQRIHTFPDEREHERQGEEGEYQEPSALLRPRDQRDSTGR